MDDIWQGSDGDPRTSGNPVGEKATYVEYLDNYRHTLRLKCEDLTAEQLATRSVPPSGLSLLGLVRHLAAVEHQWFARVLAGREEPRLYRDVDGEDLTFDGAVGARECAEDAFATWEREVAAAQAALDAVPEPELGTEHPITGREDEVVSVRDLVVHMIEEYARHCGHADLLREAIDGRTGQ